jgi:hypothetical protein
VVAALKWTAVFAAVLVPLHLGAGVLGGARTVIALLAATPLALLAGVLVEDLGWLSEVRSRGALVVVPMLALWPATSLLAEYLQEVRTSVCRGPGIDVEELRARGCDAFELPLTQPDPTGLVRWERLPRSKRYAKTYGLEPGEWVAVAPLRCASCRLPAGGLFLARRFESTTPPPAGWHQDWPAGVSGWVRRERGFEGQVAQLERLGERPLVVQRMRQSPDERRRAAGQAWLLFLLGGHLVALVVVAAVERSRA